MTCRNEREEFCYGRFLILVAYESYKDLHGKEHALTHETSQIAVVYCDLMGRSRR